MRKLQTQRCTFRFNPSTQMRSSRAWQVSPCVTELTDSPNLSKQIGELGETVTISPEFTNKMGLFGKSHGQNPKEMVNEWSHKLRKEGYNLDRQIRAIQREEEKIKRSLKEAATKNDKKVCTILAKEIIRSRKAISKIYTSKAHLNSVQMQMKNQLATLRVAGSLQKSTEVMQAMQALIRLPEIANIMQEMSKEMMKAGIIEEMLDETMSSVEDEEEMEEAAQSEVDKVLWELTQGKLGEAPAPPTAVGAPSTSKEVEPEAEPEDESELDEMQTRLEALRS